MERRKKVNIIIAILQILILSVFFIGKKFNFSLKDFIIFSTMAFFFYLIVFFILPKKILNKIHWYILGLSIVVLILLLILKSSSKIEEAPDGIYVVGLSLSYFFCDFIRNKKQKNSNKKSIEQTEGKMEIKQLDKDDDSLTRKRFYAFFIDFIISVFLFFIPYEFFVLEPLLKNQISQVNVFIITLLCCIPSALYLIFRDCPVKRSIGKQMLKLVVLTEDGSKEVSVKQCILRNIPLLFLFIEIVYFLVNKKRLGDKLAHTMVGKKLEINDF